jgi:hypothetical protein
MKVLPLADWESLLQETLAVLRDPHAVSDLREAELSRAYGELYCTDDVLADLRLDGRLAGDGAVHEFLKIHR